MSISPSLVWFRYDLRVADNPALYAAAQSGGPLVCIYIIDEAAERAIGAASKWWLHHSLLSLGEDLAQCGATLHILRGDPQSHIPELVKTCGASSVHWNRRYDAYGIETDTQIKAALSGEGVDVQSYKGNLLREPWEVKTGSGQYYKVFTPYWKACLRMDPPAPALPAPKNCADYDSAIGGLDIADLDLLPTSPNWASGFDDMWSPGSDGAHEKLSRFLNTACNDYAEQRNIPSVYGTSRLSPHLAFGEISPRQIWHMTKAAGKDDYTYLSEIGWREFSYALLFYNPKLASENFKPAFDNFEWDEDDQALTAWQKGKTGYPFVDAGMRELWATGWQHNRVRMVTASFLIKHILQDWRAGERWFWDTLVDADPASNAASWQWVAGSGADASPYFRIFNPFTQGEKFDPDGDYVRRWVPELSKLPKKYIHRPWEAPPHILKQAGVTLGGNYPRPIVDHKPARERALSAYKASREPE